jgi:hypothetical protein
LADGRRFFSLSSRQAFAAVSSRRRSSPVGGFCLIFGMGAVIRVLFRSIRQALVVLRESDGHCLAIWIASVLARGRELATSLVTIRLAGCSGAALPGIMQANPLPCPAAGPHRGVRYAMPDHKFHIGQLVSYRPAYRFADAPSGAYTVTKCLPQGNDGQFEYRIKHSGEQHERIAKEGELKVA